VTGKVSIIGGAGRVGSNTAYALQLGDACRELMLVDIATEAAQGEALDLIHGRAAAGGPRVRSGDFEAMAGSEIVVVTAGLRRQPDESRLQLIERNVNLFREIIEKVNAVELAPDAILLVVTNPVDVLTYLAATEMGWPSARAIGLGTLLDTLRFRSLLGEKLDLDPTRIEALVLGEHGDSMVPILSLLAYQGAPLSSASGYSEDLVKEAVVATRGAGADCIRLKGGAGYAVGLAVRQVVMAVLRDAGEVLPVSTLQRSGEFQGVALSLPTEIGRKGVGQVVVPMLSEEEHRGLLQSAKLLRDTLVNFGRLRRPSAARRGESASGATD